MADQTYYIRTKADNAPATERFSTLAADEVLVELVVNRQPAQGPGPARLAESSELGAVIQKGLDTLAPLDRAVIVMREVQGLPYDDIAQALGLPLGTLKARLHRARERLRTRLTRAGVAP